MIVLSRFLMRCFSSYILTYLVKLSLEADYVKINLIIKGETFMDKQEMDPHVKTGLYGTPEINPDEQHHYLGNFRERIYVLQTRETAGENRYMKAWEQQLHAHPDAVLYLNGHLNKNVLDQYIELAAKQQAKFTLKSDAIYDQSDVVAVLAAHSAVHQEPVSIEDTIDSSETSSGQKDEKKPWYKKLFG